MNNKSGDQESMMAIHEDEGKFAEVQQIVAEVYSKSPDWVTFYREVLGLGGIVRQCCPTREAMAEFERSEAYEEIQRMLAKLRERSAATPDSADEPTRVVTIRVPKSLHDAIRFEAHEHCTSMNQLCISKILQFIDAQRVPTDMPIGPHDNGDDRLRGSRSQKRCRAIAKFRESRHAK